MKSRPPRSRRLLTQPCSFTFRPTCSARRAPQSWLLIMPMSVSAAPFAQLGAGAWRNGAVVHARHQLDELQFADQALVARGQVLQLPALLLTLRGAPQRGEACAGPVSLLQALAGVATLVGELHRRPGGAQPLRQVGAFGHRIVVQGYQEEGGVGGRC